MDPALLKINIDQRSTLVKEADYGGFVKAGDIVSPFTLPEVDGGEVNLEALLSKGPVVLIFFRFAGCPVCNLTLPFYERQLYAPLSAFGATLVAVSPQVPERLVEIKRRHTLSFLVASDLGNLLGKRFGLVFTADAASQASSLARGTFLGDVTGTGTWELPMPAVIVIDQKYVVRFADITPDWMARTEAEPIIDAVRSLALVEQQ